MFLTASCFQGSSDLAHSTSGFTFGIALKWVQQQFSGMIKIVQGTKLSYIFKNLLYTLAIQLLGVLENNLCFFSLQTLDFASKDHLASLMLQRL